MSNTKCSPEESCPKGHYCDNGFHTCYACEEVCKDKSIKDYDHYCIGKCQKKGYVVKPIVNPDESTISPTATASHERQNQGQSSSTTQSLPFIATITAVIVIIAVVIILFIIIVMIYKKKRKTINNQQDVDSSSSHSINADLTQTSENQALNPPENFPKDVPSGAQTTTDDIEKGMEQFNSNSNLSSKFSYPSEKPKFSVSENELAASAGESHSLLQSVSRPVSESQLGAVGGQPQSYPDVEQAEEGNVSAMSHMYDNDSGCGSALNNGTRPSEEFQQMNRLLYQQRGIDVDRIGQPAANVAQPANNNGQNDLPLGVPLEQLFPGVVNPNRQRNRWLYEELKKIDWVMGYHSSGHSIEVYVNLGSLDPRGVEQQLADLTGAPLTKFHVKQNEDTEFLNYSHKIWMGVSFPIRLVPFLTEEITLYKNQEWNELGNHLKINCVIGGFISVEGDSGIYCITVSHALHLNSLCYVEVNDGYHLMGKCISIINTVGFDKALCEKDTSLQSRHAERCDCCVDLAIVKILSDNFDITNNIVNTDQSIHSSEKSYHLELFDWQNASLQEHEHLKNYPIQMKNRLGEVKTGVIENPCCDYSNKVKDIHMHNQIIVKSTESEFLTEGDCGCLLTSVPSGETDKVQVYGMFYGILKKTSGEQHAVAFPLSMALSIASKKDFNGKKLSLFKTPVLARANTHEIFKRQVSRKTDEYMSSLDSGIDSLTESV